MCCGKNSSSATCGHGAEIACMKEETKRIKGKEKKKTSSEKVRVVPEEEESFFKFLNEGHNGPFNKLLGAPSMFPMTIGNC